METSFSCGLDPALNAMPPYQIQISSQAAWNQILAGIAPPDIQQIAASIKERQQ